MKDKFIRIISPITAAVAALLDCAAVFLCVMVIQKIGNKLDFWQISFCIITVASVIIAVLYTKEVFSNGVNFRENVVEFVGIDEDNILEYSHIVKAESYKDTKASFKKKITERFSLLIIALDDGTQVTVNLGYTTNKTLNRILSNLNSRIK